MITGDMNPLEIIEQYPETEPVFRGYDAVLGKCLLCSYLFDSLETIAAEHNIDLEEMLAQINSSVGTPILPHD